MFTVWRNLHLIQAETKANDIYIQYIEHIYHEAQVPDQGREQGCQGREQGWVLGQVRVPGMFSKSYHCCIKSIRSARFDLVKTCASF